MPEPTKPQDRKPKAAKKAAATGVKKPKAPEGYSFEAADGEIYTLPSMAENAFEVPGRYTKDAILRPDDEQAQMRLGFALLDAADIPEKVREAIEDLPTRRMLEVLGEWMGESGGSSD